MFTYKPTSCKPCPIHDFSEDFKIKSFFHPKIGKIRTWYRPRDWLLTGRYKSRTGSTRTASPGQINSDRLGLTRIE